MGDKDKKEQLDIAAGGTGEGAEHRKAHPEKEALTRKEREAATKPVDPPKDKKPA